MSAYLSKSHTKSTISLDNSLTKQRGGSLLGAETSEILASNG